jgi:hypothetical protein
MDISVLKGKMLSNTFWDEPVATFVYLLNICPSRIVQSMTPFQKWNGTKPSVSNLKVFGSITYAHVPIQKAN